MKLNFLLFIFLFSVSSHSQKKRIDNFYFNGTSINITRIDYSKYGIANFFITVTEDDLENQVEENAIQCLKKEERIYHTLYYFIKIPKGFSLEEKEQLLSKIVNIIDNKEKIKDVYYFINLDSNFTKKLIEDKSGLNPDKFRAFIDVNSTNICSALKI